MCYEDAPATRLLATHCTMCSRPLLDAQSVEAGMGPICRKKYGAPAHIDEESRKRANKLIHEAAVTEDPARIPGIVAELCLLECDVAAEKLAERCGAIRVSQTEAGFFTAVSPYDPGFVAASRSLPGRRWLREEKANRFALEAIPGFVSAAREAYGERTIIRIDRGDRSPIWTDYAGFSGFAFEKAEKPFSAAASKVPVHVPAKKIAKLTGSTEYDPADATSRSVAGAALVGALVSGGFEKVTDARKLPRGCREEVYEMPVYQRPGKPECGHFVQVFSSVVGDGFRSCGKDAIRVKSFVRFWSKKSGSWELRTKTVGRGRRVHRTGTIEEITNRTVERARDCYRAAMEDYKANLAKLVSE